MSRIVIEVDGSVADAFLRADASQQQSISRAVNGWLKKMINTASHERHMQMLDSLSAEAEANGLTPDILADLLRDSD